MKFTKLFFTLTAFVAVLFYACKDKSTDPDPKPATVDCSSKTIGVTATVTGSTTCVDNGSIVVRATGSTGFTFKLNNGAFQADSNFNNLDAGVYTITAKDADGCSKTATYTLSNISVKGAKFALVSALIASKCQGGFCHGTGSGGAPVNNMDTDCEIVDLGALIKIKAVDEGMGSLSTTDKNKITAWLSAGGKYTD